MKTPNVYISPILIDEIIKNLEIELKQNDTAMKNFFQLFRETKDHDISMLILGRIKSISTDTLLKHDLSNQLKTLNGGY